MRWLDSLVDQNQGATRNTFAFEKEIVSKNKISSIELWQYSYSYGEPEQPVKKYVYRKFDAQGNKIYAYTPYECFSFTYDDNGHIIEMIDIDSHGNPKYTTKFKYDSNGNLLEKSVDGSSWKETYEYDENNRKTKYLYFSEGKIKEKYTFEYGNSGKLALVSIFSEDGSSRSTRIKYDEKNNMLNYVEGVYSYNYQYKYNEDGVIIEKRKASCRTDKLFGTDTTYKTYQYDNNKNLIAEWYNPSEKSIYRYNNLNQLVEETNRSDNFERKCLFSYDGFGNLTQKILTRANNQGVYDYEKTIYKYDSKGNIFEIKYSDKNNNPYRLYKIVYQYY